MLRWQAILLLFLVVLVAVEVFPVMDPFFMLLLAIMMFMGAVVSVLLGGVDIMWRDWCFMPDLILVLGDLVS